MDCRICSVVSGDESWKQKPKKQEEKTWNDMTKSDPNCNRRPESGKPSEMFKGGKPFFESSCELSCESSRFTRLNV